MNYKTKWVAWHSPPFDWYVIVHSADIGEHEQAQAQQYLDSENDPHVVTDDALAFIVFLDISLKDDSRVRSEIKAESFRRLEQKAAKTT
jgi:hypothetical protein